MNIPRIGIVAVAVGVVEAANADVADDDAGHIVLVAQSIKAGHDIAPVAQGFDVALAVASANLFN